MEDVRRSKRFLSLEDRLALYAEGMRKKAARLPPGVEKDVLLRKASQAAGARAGEDGADNPGQPPLVRKP